MCYGLPMDTTTTALIATWLRALRAAPGIFARTTLSVLVNAG